MLLTNIELFAGQQATLHDDDVLSTVMRLVLHGRSKSRFSISIERTIIVQSSPDEIHLLKFRVLNRPRAVVEDEE